MISRIRGTLLPREAGMEPDAGGGTVEVATAGGVVYRVEVPRTVAERLPKAGAEVELRTHHVVKADDQVLYGFLEPAERLLFRTLLTASGVGGRTALALMSTMPVARLARAIEQRDLALIAQAPGIGKKSAEKLAVALSERVKALGITAASGADAEGEGAQVSHRQAAVRALLALGMSVDEADRALTTVLDHDPDAETDTLIRKALARR
jgi:holliday junction DNA helicase RuvA